MSFALGRYRFVGPIDTIYQVDEIEGVIAMLSKNNDGIYSLTKVEEAENIRSKFMEQIDCTKNREKLKVGNIIFGINYTPNLQIKGRKKIVREIKNTYKLN